MTGIREWMRDCISHMTGIRERMRDCISVEIRTQFLVLLVVASLFTLSGECIVLYLVYQTHVTFELQVRNGSDQKEEVVVLPDSRG